MDDLAVLVKDYEQRSDALVVKADEVWGRVLDTYHLADIDEGPSYIVGDLVRDEVLRYEPDGILE